MTTRLPPVEIKAHQIWCPLAPSKVAPRRVIWVGDDQYMGKAVSWTNDLGGALAAGGSMMQHKAFVAWVRKNGAFVGI
jgi:hypothetical protein